MTVSDHDDRPAHDDRSPGEIALGSLLDGATTMRPDELPAAVVQAAATIGLRDVTLHVADKSQQELLPLLHDGGGPLDIDEAGAGRCFRTSAVVAEDQGAAGTRLWFPVLNGTSRVGVLGAVAPDDPLVRDRGRQLAYLTAELIKAKADYGDHLATANRRRELSLAAEARWALVPPLTFMNPDVSVAAYLEPAYDIAGDTFDYAINANTAHLAIFDAVGHGTEASRIANVALLTYRNSRRRRRSIVETLDDIDAAISGAFERSAYCTTQVATLDLPDGTLRWVNAGHPPPLLVRAGQPVEELVGAPVLPAGIMDRNDVPEIHEAALEPGDVVAFYSDGITEARHPGTGTMYGSPRLADRLSAWIDTDVTMPELARRTVHDVAEHQGGRVADDATVLLAGWRADLRPG